MTARPRADDAEVEGLLGAYALDAVDPDEALAIEAVLARRPDLAREADELAHAAALARGHRSDAAAARDARPRHRRRAARAGAVPVDPVVELYVALSDGLARTVAELPDDALDVVTPNGLTAHDLVVHMAAQESLLAQNLGVPTAPDLDEDEIVTRTHAPDPASRRPRPRRRGRAVAGLGRGQPGVGGRQPRPHRDLARARPHPRRHPARPVVRGVGAHRRPAPRRRSASRRRPSPGTSA